MPSDLNTSFSAPYDKTTKFISAAVFVLLLLLTVAIPGVFVACFAALLLAGAYAWSPRSYTISEGSIIVKRLIGSARIPVSGIREARIATPDDFRGCIRLFGNGGLFGYYRQFRTAKLGICTWYVTSRHPRRDLSLQPRRRGWLPGGNPGSRPGPAGTPGRAAARCAPIL